MKQTLGRIIIGSGIALVLAGCGAAASSAPTGASSPPTAVLSAPAATAAAATAPTTTAGAAPSAQAGANPGRMRGVTGKVEAVNGSTFTVQDQRQQSTISVALNASTQVFKQTSIAIASAPVGETISAFGQLSGDVFTATQIRVGALMGPNGNGPNGQPAQPNGTAQPGGMPQAGGNRPSNGQPQPNGTAQPVGREAGDRLIGTIEQVSSDTLTVKTLAGATIQVHLATNGQMFQQVAATNTDITAGEQVIVMGQRNDTTVTAARIVIVPAMAQ